MKPFQAFQKREKDKHDLANLAEEAVAKEKAEREKA